MRREASDQIFVSDLPMWQKVLNFFRKSGLHPFPLIGTLRNYSVRKAIADFRAGTNVALLDFPQGMAYALIALTRIYYEVVEAKIPRRIF